MAWIDWLLDRMVDLEASDLHLSSSVVPMFRKDGEIRMAAGANPTSAEELEQHFKEITPETYWQEYRESWDTDFAYLLEGRGRFRVNLYHELRGPAAAIRFIKPDVPSPEELGLTRPIVELTTLSRGLVLVTGPTGSGKTTTMASLLHHLSKIRRSHIITIEDPVEYVIPGAQCLVHQREVGRHTKGFKFALRSALREDPDVIFIGEMRDLETTELALEASETGHLVFATLHTATATSAIDRIIDQFPEERQNQIRGMLALSLRCVVAQTLCKRAGGGLVAAREIMMVNSAVSSLVREGKTYQLPSIMQVSSRQGMLLLNDSLIALVRDGTIEPKEAFMRSVDRTDMAARLRHEGHGDACGSLQDAGVSDAGSGSGSSGSGSSGGGSSSSSGSSSGGGEQPRTQQKFESFEDFAKSRRS